MSVCSFVRFTFFSSKIYSSTAPVLHLGVALSLWPGSEGQLIRGNIFLINITRCTLWIWKWKIRLHKRNPTRQKETFNLFKTLHSPGPSLNVKFNYCVSRPTIDWGNNGKGEIDTENETRANFLVNETGTIGSMASFWWNLLLHGNESVTRVSINRQKRTQNKRGGFNGPKVQKGPAWKVHGRNNNLASDIEIKFTSWINYLFVNTKSITCYRGRKLNCNLTI